MWNSQVWHTDVRSMASTEEPVTRNSVIDVDLETSGGYNLLSAESVSFIERVNTRLRASIVL